MPSVFVGIGDGFDLQGKVDGLAGAFPDVKFGYRVCRPVEALRYQSAATPEQQVELGTELLQKQLTEVTAKTDAGNWERVNIPAAQFASLHPVIFLSMIAHVIGRVGPVIVREDVPK